MIVAPVGRRVPSASTTSTRATHVDAGQTVGHARRARAPRRRSRSPFRAASSACSPTPASASARASPSPGCESPERHARPCASPAGARPSPNGALTNADLEQRVDTTDEWIVERTGIRERRVAGDGRDDREPRHRRRRRGDQARRAHARRRSTCSSSPPPRPSSRSPTPARSSATASGCAAARSTSTPAAPGFVYGLVVGVVAAQRPATSTTCSSSAPRRSVARHRPRRPRHRASSSATAPPPSCLAPRHPTTGPGSSPGTSAATARRPACSRSPPVAAACPATPETVAAGEHYLKMEGQEVFRRAVRVVVDSATRHARPRRRHRRRRRLVRPAPGQRPHHRGGRAAGSGIADGAHAREHRPLRQHVGGVDPARARRGRRRRPAAATATSCCCRGFGAGHDVGQRAAALGHAVT